MKTKRINMYEFIDKTKMYKALRPQLCGVYHENGYKVASDAKILVAIKENYPDEFEGKIIDKKGEFINAKFPNWRYVLPQSLYDYEHINININDIDAAIKKFDADKKVNKDICFINLKYKDRIITFDAKRIKQIFKFMKATNINDAYINFDKFHIYFKSEQTEGIFLGQYMIDKDSTTFETKEYINE